MAHGATTYRWRRPVRRLVRRFEDSFRTKGNTYIGHPDGWDRERDSVDFWSPAGRGWPIDERVGDAIVARLLGRRRRLRVDWLLWRGRLWTPAHGWVPYWDKADMHYDHVHVTFKRGLF